MSFRDAWQREQRRRRVLVDESASAGNDSSRPRKQREASVANAPSYSESARLAEQPRIWDVVPRRRFSIAVVLLLGMTAAAGIELLAAHHRHWSWSLDGRVDLSVIDPTVRGNLAAWFSSLVLASLAVLFVLIYSIRRHKTNDYRGRYRLWLWAAAAALLASLDATAGLRATVQDALVLATGMTWIAGGGTWTATAYASVLSFAAFALAFEMWRSKLAVVALAAAASAYLTAATIRLGWLLADAPLAAWMAQSSAAMLGHLLLLLTGLLYARHVFLDAQGAVPVRTASATRRTAKKKKARPDDAQPKRRLLSLRRADKQREPAASRSRSAKRTSDLDEQPVKRRSSSKRPAATAPDEEELAGGTGDSSANAPRRLSKAERKRLRKQRRQQREAA